MLASRLGSLRRAKWSLVQRVEHASIQGPCAMQAMSGSSKAHGANQEAGPSISGRKPEAAWEIRMLYDGECSLCMKEVHFLRRRDAGKGRIDFVDIAAPGYDPADHQGVTFEQGMRRIHAILPDGRVIKDVEVFRKLYEAVGLGWLYSVTKVPAVEKAANTVYTVWAKYRTQLTGRGPLEAVLEHHRQQQLGSKLCDERCSVPQSSENAAKQQQQ